MTTHSTRTAGSSRSTRLVDTAAGVISRAMQQGCTLPAALANALDSARLLQSPETAAAMQRLRDDQAANDHEYETATARIAALEKAAVEGRAALASFCHDHPDPGTAALGALYLLQQATHGTPMQPGETVPKFYQASHESIVMGLYITAAEARRHCETEMRRDIPGASLDWIEDDEDGVAELVAAFSEDERPTGYVVTALEVTSDYHEGVDK
ncbi:hypothetical protein [Streptomyces sp. SID8352]|uniref:hypothetical protein n=1 Tax=Streptomyces sp. SID8352 TaxID=2690338 RepID=UPI00136F8E87|nr:hypothetical protein [Streptomyces sp. SID8352]MYU24517.1 hypothetical protein [Streptomyces sp. SID8352]